MPIAKTCGVHQWLSPPGRRLVLLLLLTSVLFFHGTSFAEARSLHSHRTCGYPAIFSFGDSLTDTGNRAYRPDHARSYCIDPPYGMTFFRRPTGRCSDGRLIVDFITEKLGLPRLPPYLAVKDQHNQWPLIQHGVNFAVAGSTALNVSLYEARGIQTQTNRSLTVQLHWFKTLLPSLCPNGTRNCNLLARSLFLVGEIGGNDLNYLFLDGMTSADEVRATFPIIIEAISTAIQDLIRIGARTLVVPGNFPLGCSVAYLRQFLPPAGGDHRDSYYDPETGCIRWLNRFAEDFNSLLKEELDHLRQKHPHASIIYADYYGAASRIFLNPAHYGFTITLEACCGSYNAITKKRLKCGDKRIGSCTNPSHYVSWDGMHMTEVAYKIISSILLDGSSTIPMVVGLCPFNLAKQEVMHNNITIATRWMQMRR